MTDDPTLRFYADNAATYAEHVTTPTGPRLSAFLARVPAGGKILELGCGNGRDAAHMLSLGFDVEATDGTPELAAEAERRIGRPVRILRFEQLDADAAYDGIWACASLLHAPAADLVDILGRIHRALRPGGVFTASFKAGSGEGHDGLGRYFNYPSAERLRADYAAAGWADIVLETQMGTGYDAQPTAWLWVTARRSP
ncbi:SAM-dependent methyltransferase [Devosia sp. Root685]|uniref:class I SAM-dependent methyltransferase n=1 Tax=Devosia sp. Root685 TaxID=1736587 RepID=UPI0006F4979E|nr:class I SAM-dependent methyltransferase [Devosia sp. Root685]KRA95490.1 SAM-dependent methyltransferase [Devosia sp. Root685]